jgi:heme-degrading monooxygenase HmoA
MYEIFWEYEVRPGQTAAFEVLYGGDGEWARLFRGADGYVETLLFRDTDRLTHYLTIDRWRSRAAFDTFIETAGPAYAALDLRGDALTVRERRISAFDAPEEKS